MCFGEKSPRGNPVAHPRWLFSNRRRGNVGPLLASTRRPNRIATGPDDKRRTICSYPDAIFFLNGDQAFTTPALDFPFKLAWERVRQC